MHRAAYNLIARFRNDLNSIDIPIVNETIAQYNQNGLLGDFVVRENGELVVGHDTNVKTMVGEYVINIQGYEGTVQHLNEKLNEDEGILKWPNDIIDQASAFFKQDTTEGKERACIEMSDWNDPEYGVVINEIFNMNTPLGWQNVELSTKRTDGIQLWRNQQGKWFDYDTSVGYMQQKAHSCEKAAQMLEQILTNKRDIKKFPL